MFLHSRRENVQKLMSILQLYFIPEEIKNIARKIYSLANEKCKYQLLLLRCGEKKNDRIIFCSLVVKCLPMQGGAGSIPGEGAKIQHALRPSKKKTQEQKKYFNK